MSISAATEVALLLLLLLPLLLLWALAPRLLLLDVAEDDRVNQYRKTPVEIATEVTSEIRSVARIRRFRF